MAYGYTIFCDDIRQEIGGKVSFMGIYRGAMLVHGDFPATLPKFALSCTYVEQSTKAPDDLQVLIFMPGDSEDKPSIVGPFPMAKVLADMKLPPLNERDPDKVLRCENRVILAPLILKSEGLIKVRFKAGDQITKGGTLRVSRFKPTEKDSELVENS